MLDNETKVLAILELAASAQPDERGNLPPDVVAAMKLIAGSGKPPQGPVPQAPAQDAV